MIIRIERKKHGFSIIANEPLRDKRLSYRARGVLAYLLTRPDNWEVKMEEVTANGTEGRDAIRKVMRELEQNGYASLQPVRNKDGKVCGRAWVVRECAEPTESLKTPTSAKTERRKNRTSEKPNVGKSGDIIITEKEVITEKEEITECDARAKKPVTLEAETLRGDDTAAAPPSPESVAYTNDPAQLEMLLRDYYKARPDDWNAVKERLDRAARQAGVTYNREKVSDVVTRYCEWSITQGHTGWTFSRHHSRLRTWMADQPSKEPKYNTTTTAPPRKRNLITA